MRSHRVLLHTPAVSPAVVRPELFATEGGQPQVEQPVGIFRFFVRHGELLAMKRWRNTTSHPKGCHQEQWPCKTQQETAGSWWIRAGGSFEITPPSGERPPLTGSWEENKGVVVFRNNSDAAVCKGVPGRYRWEMSETSGLRFMSLEDSCKPRIAHMKNPFDPAPPDDE
jgi:hypothetical protein